MEFRLKFDNFNIKLIEVFTSQKTHSMLLLESPVVECCIGH